MAALYDRVFILGTTGIGGVENKFYFRARKGFYTGTIASATGVTVATASADTVAPLTPVKELLKSGVLKTVEVVARAANAGSKSYKAKIHYAVAQDSTVEAALKATDMPAISGSATSGLPIVSISTPLRVTGRS